MSLSKLSGKLFGSSAGLSTPPPLPTSQLAALTERQASLASLYQALLQQHHILGKKRDGGNGQVLPLEWVGEALDGLSRNYQETGTHGSAQAITQLAAASHTLANLTQSLLDQMTLGVLAQMDETEREYKSFEKALKDAEKKRAAVESAAQKIQKAKKEDPSLEDDLNDATTLYDLRCSDLAAHAGRMEDLTHAGSVDAMRGWLDGMLELSRGWVDALEQAREGWPDGLSEKPKSAKRPAVTPRGSSLQIPLAVTRASRSSSVSSLPGQGASTSPGVAKKTSFLDDMADRTATLRGKKGERRSTVTSLREGGSRPGSRDGTPSGKESRSRSGSVLARFTGGGTPKKKTADGSDADEEGEGADKEEAGNSPSAARGLTLPTMPTVGMPSIKLGQALKKLGGSSPRYDSLGGDEEDDAPGRPITSSSSASPAPPRLKRSSTAPASPSSTSFGGNGTRYVAKWEFVTSSEGELALVKGEEVDLERKVGDDWGVGRAVRSGKKGLFPLNHVELAPSSSASSQGGAAALAGKKEGVAGWAFAGTGAGELTFEKGDAVRVEREVNADWSIGSVVGGPRDGKRGMFPSSFVKMSEEQQPASAAVKDPYATQSEDEGWGSSHTGGEGSLGGGHDDETDDDDAWGAKESIKVQSSSGGPTKDREGGDPPSSIGKKGGYGFRLPGSGLS